MTPAPNVCDRAPATRLQRDRGAAAVEFALLMPVLLTLVLGIAEFGRAYSIQTNISAAAREGVRTMALQNSASEAKASTKNAAAPAVTLTDAQIVVSPSPCAVNGTATVTVSYDMPFITSYLGIAPLKLTGKGVMRCNG